MPILKDMVDMAKGKLPVGVLRSNKWPAVRAEHLRKYPTCAVCGGSKYQEVHHKLPFHLHPEMELEPTNLITLCESNKNGVNCHLFVGHLGNYKSFNVAVDSDASLWLSKLSTKPDPKE